METPEKMRLVLNLNKAMPYEMRVDGNTLLISLAASGAQAMGADQVTRFRHNNPCRYPAKFRDIGFRRGKNGGGVTVDLSDANTGIDIRQQGSSLLVDFAKTTLPDRLRTRLDVTDFATPVTSVTAAKQGMGASDDIPERAVGTQRVPDRNTVRHQ